MMVSPKPSTMSSIEWSESESRSVVSESLWPHGLYSPWNSPGQNTAEGSLFLLEGIFPTQGWNPGLPHCRQILYQLSHKASPRILEWVAYPSPADLPDPGIEPGSPALQADSLSTELSGKPKGLTKYQIEGMTGSVLCWSCRIPACENQWSSFLLSLVTYSVMSGWQFKTNHCGSVYSIEIGKHYK